MSLQISSYCQPAILEWPAEIQDLPRLVPMKVCEQKFPTIRNFDLGLPPQIAVIKQWHYVVFFMCTQCSDDESPGDSYLQRKVIDVNKGHNTAKAFEK
jgi:hypothetical protein